MKRLIFLLLSIISISSPCFSQWELIFTEDGSISRPGEFRDMHFSDSLNGIVIGDYYTGIVRTNDGGKTWNFDKNSFRDDLYMLSFANKDTGLVIVTNNYAYFTNNGGKTFSKENWVVPIIGHEQSYDYFMVNRNIIYTVGSKTKVTKTIDGGNFWKPYEDFNFSNSINDITCLGADTCFACGDVAKIIKTVDGGITWIDQEVLLNNNFNVVTFLNANYGFIGGQNGILIKTTDGGKNWKELNSKLNKSIITIYFLDKLIGYAASNDGIISKTVDGGESWNLINTNTQTFYYINKIFFKDNTTIFALIDSEIYEFDLSKVISTKMDFEVDNNNYQVYPNPVNNFLYISGTLNTIETIELLDISGKTLIIANNYKEKGIFVNQLNSGIYLLKITSNKKIITKKILKY